MNNMDFKTQTHIPMRELSFEEVKSISGGNWGRLLRTAWRFISLMGRPEKTHKDPNER